MKIGTLTIKERNRILNIKKKVLVIAKTLNFSENIASQIATELAKLSKDIFDEIHPTLFSIHLSDTDKKQLHFLFESINSPSFPLNTTLFDKPGYKETEAGNYMIKLSKELPLQSIELNEELIDKIQNEFLRLSEKELLAELEKKNQELTRAYEALEKSQKELLNRTQKLAKVGGWEIQLHDMSLHWTDEVYRIHELPKSHIPKIKEGINFFTPEVRPIMSKAVKNAVGKGVHWDLELPFISAKGNKKWVRTIGYPKRENGKTIALSGIFQDITRQKRSERLLEKKNAELEFKNKELEQFAYISSHDLQEPLRTVTSFVDLLKKQYGDQLDDKANKYLQFIEQSTFRMRDFITGLLEYSRIGREKRLVFTDCNEVVQHILSDMHTAILEANGEIKVETLPVAVAYQQELRQLFLNLISNALKFRKTDTQAKIKISARQKNNEWEFAIADNGIGIDEKFADKVFIIFQRLHPQNTYEGTGIGLAYCKKIVELHNGRIWFESTPGEGTTFFFTIPI